MNGDEGNPGPLDGTPVGGAGKTGGARGGPGSTRAIGQIARSAATRARYSSANGLRKVGEVVEERTGVVDFARNRPLLALGAVFTVGFAAAYITEPKEGNPHVERVRLRARALLLGNIAAAAAAILPSLTGDGGIIEVVSGWLHDDDDSFEG